MENREIDVTHKCEIGFFWGEKKKIPQNKIENWWASLKKKKRKEETNTGLDLNLTTNAEKFYKHL